MIKRVGPKTIQRKDSRKNLIIIILFLYDHPLSSIKEICRYDDNKNYNTTKKYVRYLLEYEIIYKIPFWQGERFYVKVDGNQILTTQIKYHATKHRVSLRLNEIMNCYHQLKENILKNDIYDFTKITKSSIPKYPIDVTGLDSGCMVVVKYLNLIMLATKVMILEEKRSRKNNSFDFQKLVKREARICEFWLDLELFLDKYFGKTTTDAAFMCMVKSSQIYQDCILYRDYFTHLTRSKTSFSQYIKALTQIKLGRKQEYADSHNISMPALSKMVKNFTDKTGRINISYLSDMRRIENANQVKFKENDLIDLWHMDLFSDELNRTRWADDERSEKEKEKTRKIITQIFPQMKVA